jgi:hypothetical protein
MIKSLLLSVLLTILFLLPSTSFSQTSTKVIGKIYTKEEANQLYGPVIKSIEISTNTLYSLAQKTPNYIMFNVMNDKIIVLDAQRKEIFGDVQNLTSSTSFHVYSTSQLLNLLKSGGESITYVQSRNNVMTITNGAFTMELAQICPPFCIN